MFKILLLSMDITTLDGKTITLTDEQLVELSEKGHRTEINQVINGNSRSLTIKMLERDLLMCVYVSRTRALREQFPDDPFVRANVFISTEAAGHNIVEATIEEEVKVAEHLYPCIVDTAVSNGYPVGTLLLIKLYSEGEGRNEPKLFDLIETGDHAGVFNINKIIPEIKERQAAADKANKAAAKKAEKAEEKKA